MSDRTKLPKWAQEELCTLEYRCKELTEALNDRAYESQYEGDEPRVFLLQTIEGRVHEKALGGNYTTVIYRTPVDEIAVSVTLWGGQLVIKANGRDIAIHPEASNVVRLTGKSF